MIKKMLLKTVKSVMLYSNIFWNVTILMLIFFVVTFLRKCNYTIPIITFFNKCSQANVAGWLML